MTEHWVLQRQMAKETNKYSFMMENKGTHKSGEKCSWVSEIGS